MKSLEPLSNATFSLAVALTTAIAILISIAHQGWGDIGLVSFLIVMVFTVAVIGYRLASVCEQCQQLLLPLIIVSTPFASALLLVSFYAWSSALMTVGLVIGWAVSIAAVIFGVLVGRPTFSFLK